MSAPPNPERRRFHERFVQHMSRRKNGSSAGPSQSVTGDDESGDQIKTDSTFECNVCFDVPHDPVVTPCGHLYCWPCLYRWMTLHADSPQCPVCKAGVDKATVIPIYGRGRSEADDPRQRPLPEDQVPPRPSGFRATPLHQRVPANAPFNFNQAFGFPAYPGNYEFSLSNFGFFPSIFGFQIAHPNINEPLRGEPRENQEENTPEPVSKIFAFLAVIIIFIIAVF